MTAPALTAEELAELFDTPVTVTPWTPGDVIADGAAMVLTGAEGGETILITNYYENAKARPLVCSRHGLQRHDRRGAGWRCVKCAPPQAAERSNHVSGKEPEED